jgi:hypothetical protein
MTEKDEVIRKLEVALRYVDYHANNCRDQINDALIALRAMTLASELQLKLAEDVAEAKRSLGPNAQVAFEIVAGPAGVVGCYSVGLGSKHSHTMDVHGRGASLQAAIQQAKGR